MRIFNSQPQLGIHFPGGIFLGCLFVLISFEALQAGPPAPPSFIRDLQLSVKVRKALRKEPELARINFGVRVKNQTAFLWGPVPSRRLLRRAIKIVENIPEIVRVHSKLYVEDPDNFDPPYLPDAPPSAWLEEEPFPEKVPVSEKNNTVVAKSDLQWVPANKIQTNVRFYPALDAVEEEQEIPQSLVPSPKKIQSGRKVALQKLVTPSLDAQISKVHLSNENYQGLLVQIRNRDVYLQGKVNQLGHVYEMARSLSRIPGVNRVVIGEIQTGR